MALPCNKDMPERICSVCPKARPHRQWASKNFELIHVDIWGAYKCTTHDGCRYFLVIVDDDSRATWVHLMASKSNAFPLLQSFIMFVKNQFDVSVKVVRSDNGMEFQDHTTIQFYAQQGIIYQKSCVDTPQQNGIVERKQKHLLEVARTLMIQANLPQKF